MVEKKVPVPFATAWSAHSCPVLFPVLPRWATSHAGDGARLRGRFDKDVTAGAEHSKYSAAVWHSTQHGVRVHLRTAF